jgi:hypothetical protein
MKRETKPDTAASPAKQVAAFIAKFDPKMAKQITSLRKATRKRFPTAVELVYDNYNFLVFGFCTTERASDCLVSLACQAKGLSLCFYWGKTLPDPHKVLTGSGNQVRWIRLEGPATLARPEVEALLQAAADQAKHPLSAEKGYTIVKSISAKQRPRRASSS